MQTTADGNKTTKVRTTWTL